jgi:translocator protein
MQSIVPLRVEIMIKSWMVIGGVALILGGIGGSIVPPSGVKWFARLRRPYWLTFEPLIPLVWTTVFICGAWSAYIVWEHDPGSRKTWLLMGLYLLLELVTLSYNSVMLTLKSLKAGTLIGGTGFVLAAILAILVLPISVWAAALLLPYLLWSPIGTYTTWELMRLNPQDA